MSAAKLSQLRDRVLVNPHGVSYTSYSAPGTLPHALAEAAAAAAGSVTDRFEDSLRIEVIHSNAEELVVDIIGVDASFANALRRILIAEVPTVAIEDCYITINTSIMPDEVLVHRLGLIPIMADPRKFVMREPGQTDLTDGDTVIFTLDVSYKQCAEPGKGAEPSKVLSSDLKFLPQGAQEPNSIYPVHPDILICKLKPQQAISLQAFCRKGIGSEHAKWSPVATASYRLLPDIQFTRPVENDEARALVKICPMRVFDLEDIVPAGKGASKKAGAASGNVKAVVARPRDCSMCRECTRNPASAVKLMRVKDHFIFDIESTGILAPEILVEEAINILQSKCTTLQAEINEFRLADAGETVAPMATD